MCAAVDTWTQRRRDRDNGLAQAALELYGRGNAAKRIVEAILGMRPLGS
jgi:hypothetical protein